MNKPIINTKCKSVVNFGTIELSQLIKDLQDTCFEKEAVTAGLSAPQIGISLRVCLCRRMDLEEKSEQPLSLDELWEVMINPIITKSSNKVSIYWEGCLSVGEGPNGLYGPVKRPNTVEISYQNAKGKNKKLKCVGFFSHIVQHELDHLNGIIFLKYIENPKNIWLCEDLDKYYETNEEYPTVQTI